MKNQKKTNIALGLIFAMAMSFVTWSPVQAQSNEPAKKKDMMNSKMMEQCGEMKQQKQKMMMDIMAQDSLLSEMVVKMNRAPEDKKVIVMARVITHLVDQRVSMDSKKATMNQMMMKHMMKHMTMGDDSMSKCPMMKEMKNMDEKSKGDHKMHHDNMN